jgi:hypothetical protein
VQFVAGQATAQRWLDHNQGGRAFELRDAYELGRRATARLRLQTATPRSP